MIRLIRKIARKIRWWYKFRYIQYKYRKTLPKEFNLDPFVEQCINRTKSEVETRVEILKPN